MVVEMMLRSTAGETAVIIELYARQNDAKKICDESRKILNLADPNLDLPNLGI